MVKFDCPGCGMPVLAQAESYAQVVCDWCDRVIEFGDEAPEYTEDEWLSGTPADSQSSSWLALQFAQRHVSDRELWLFCYACCRCRLDRIEDALERAERGVTDQQARSQAYASAWHVEDVRHFLNGGSREAYEHQARPLIRHVASVLWGGGNRDLSAEIAAQMELLRDVVGNPFRPVSKAAPAVLAWNGGTVAKLAQAIFDGCNFSDLPVLADALEEAGCGEELLLSHLRGPGPHVRGCWALDLLRSVR